MSGFFQRQSPGGRILVVDDDDAARYAKTRILRQTGYTILEASSGAEALQTIADQPPHLVLLDVRLPDINGMELCRRLKADPRTSEILILQMSATFRDDQAKIAGLECGADGYIAEPMEPSLFLATIAAYLRIQQAEQAVRDHALEWQATFNAIGDGIALLDTDGRIIRSNRALTLLLKTSEPELLNASLDSVLPPADGHEIIWSNLTAGARLSTERSAGDRIFALSIDPLSGPHGRLLGAVCIVSDITERKRMNERLWHTQKLESIGLLAGGVAHDFNNLITGILGNASLALDSIYDPPSAEHALRDIIRASERAADLTRQLLAYAGKGKFVVERIDLSETVTAMLPLVKTSFSRKIDLQLNVAPDLPAIEADRTQIEHIIMNVLINAAESIGDNSGKVTVTTKAVEIAKGEGSQFLSDREVRGDYVLLEVRDTGEGMSEETVRQIFDPFFTTKFMGRGLGLSAVLGILRGHKGAIRVTSSPGHGSTFELLFPSVTSPADVKLPKSPAARRVASAPRGTVLVVDDEPLVRKFFASTLKHYGYEVVEAENGAEAARIFTADPARFAAVLLDLVMPVMSGKDVLPILLEARPGIHVVVTSGQVEDEVRQDLADWPIAGFIQKPCAAKQVADKIQDCAEASMAVG